jgi:hypothetical protein
MVDSLLLPTIADNLVQVNALDYFTSTAPPKYGLRYDDPLLQLGSRISTLGYLTKPQQQEKKNQKINKKKWDKLINNNIIERKINIFVGFFYFLMLCGNDWKFFFFTIMCLESDSLAFQIIFNDINK